MPSITANPYKFCHFKIGPIPTNDFLQCMSFALGGGNPTSLAILDTVTRTHRNHKKCNQY